MQRKLLSYILLIATFSASSSLVHASNTQEIHDHLESVKTLYNAKSYIQSISKLEEITEYIMRQRADQLITFLPNAPKGWKKSSKPAKADIGIFGAASATQEYESNNNNISLSIANGENASEPVDLWYDKVDKHKTALKHRGYRGIFSKKNPKKSYSKNNRLTLAISDVASIEVEGETLTIDEAKILIDAMDIDGLKKMAAN